MAWLRLLKTLKVSVNPLLARRIDDLLRIKLADSDSNWQIRLAGTDQLGAVQLETIVTA